MGVREVYISQVPEGKKLLILTRVGELCHVPNEQKSVTCSIPTPTSYQENLSKKNLHKKNLPKYLSKKGLPKNLSTLPKNLS